MYTHTDELSYSAVLCRGLMSLSECEEAASTELMASTTQQCGSLQAATGNLLQTVDATTDKLNTFDSHVTSFCEEMQEVRRVKSILDGFCTNQRERW